MRRQGMLWIVPGHGSRPHYDPGATAGGLEEAVLVRELAAEMVITAQAAHLPVHVAEVGYYSQRNGAAVAAARAHPDRRVAVVHLHLNAARGAARYAMAMHDRRSKGGAVLSMAMALAMKQSAGPWQNDVRAMAVFNDRPEKGDQAWLYRAYGCIDEIYHGPANISACLLECGFITDPDLRAWWTDKNRRRLADRLVQATVEWTGHGRRVRRGDTDAIA